MVTTDTLRAFLDAFNRHNIDPIMAHSVRYLFAVTASMGPGTEDASGEPLLGLKVR